MKSPRRVWILIGSLLALVVATGFLARPEDELATVMKFKSRIYKQNHIVDPADPTDPGSTLFLFRASPEDVRSTMPGMNLKEGGAIPFPMPGGRKAVLTRMGHSGPSSQEEWSIVVVGDDRPWYQAALCRIRTRIGL